MVAFDNLRLIGFKSFVEATDMPILPGLTGIVGPNGCGKSNLVEALRWVMGESSAKRLRGGEMDDVIFSGAAGRPPRNQAEVALRLDNSAFNAPAQFNAAPVLEVTRKVVRGQGSAYRINGRDQRAQDLKLLFADLAAGAASNALVAQGRVAALINARPTDRRALLEEAAGITGLYARRREAETRLRACENNLDRVADVLAAKQAQCKTLERQAAAGRRYQTLQNQRRAAEATLALHQWLRVERDVQRANTALAQGETAAEQAQIAEDRANRAEDAARDALEPQRLTHREAAARAQRLHLALQGLEAEAARLDAKTADLGRQLNQVGDDLAHATGQAEDAQAHLQQLNAEEATLHDARAAAPPQTQALEAALHAAEAQEQAAAKTLSTLVLDLSTTRNAQQAQKTRRAQLHAQAAVLRDRLDALGAMPLPEGPDSTAIDAQIKAQEATQHELEHRQAALDQARQALQAQEAALASAAAAHRECDHIQARLSAEIEGLTAALRARKVLSSAQEADSEQAMQTLAQALVVSPDEAPAVAAALAGTLEARLGDDAPPTSSKAAGRWRALPLDPAPPFPEGLGSLQAAVTAPAWVAQVLAYVGLAEDEAQATALQARLSPGQALTTRAGGLWRWDGYVAGKQQAASDTADLEQRHQLLSLQAQAAKQTPELARARDTLAQQQARVEAAQEHVGACAHALATAQRASAQHGQHIAQAQRALAAHRAAAAERQAEEVGTRRDLATTEQELRGMPALEGLAAQLTEQEAARQAAYENHQKLQAATRLARAALETQTRDLIALDVRLGAVARARATFDSQLTAAQGQLTVLRTRAKNLETERRDLQTRPGELAKQTAELSEQHQQALAAQRVVGDALAEAETALRALRAATRKAQNAHGDAREARARLAAEQSAAQDRLTEVAQQAYKTFKRPAADLLELTRAAALDTLPASGEVEQSLRRVQRQIDQLGPVNLSADRDLSALTKDLTRLQQEVDELTRAVGKLRRVIAELNQEGRGRLQQAFRDVGDHFSALFARLFAGGKARLQLVGAEDPLEAGLEIIASPPGKRLQTLSLLSGGEQTLTALALIFAMFRTKSTPLCVLDEVDAPLDDANVERLCSLLEEMAAEGGTRFLIVTHNALTMARVHRLFGVTMAEKGVSRLVSVDLQTAEQHAL